MDIKYNHIEVEKNKNQKWIDKKFFSTHSESSKPFCIILPPPNVTGKLHLGHAWDSYIQDTIIRYKKLNHFDVLFVPGLDHAGIATQVKVEEKLQKEFHLTKYDLGREKFLSKVWNWKEEYASSIRSQWAKLGLALDYENEKFTLDPVLSKAVNKVFISMWNDKLIYRKNKAINWDPVLKTVISNIEVINKETPSQMYYFKYPLLKGGFIEIATTRPETMFSDVAIGVNGKDERFKHLHNEFVLSPLTNRKLKIITDDYIDINKGTGMMKISAHAEEDIKIILKHNLEIIECIDKDGLMNHNAQKYQGQDRFVVRKNILNDLKDFLIKTEEIISNVGYSERTNAPIEILVQEQWFVKMKPLANKIIKNLSSKNSVKFHPERFKDILISWMENIEDWCISRQLWWGHQIPAWYKDGHIKVQETSPGLDWVRDEDVLDTWFSSALAPFSFLNWPQDDIFVKRFYPTSLLVTGYDIIFFWVARMYFQGLNFMKQIPFKEVLIHGLIRDESGQKMSKSLGNGIDPMEVIDHYGSDALRYFLLTNSTPGQDLRYSKEKIESAWNLNNKIWNISRYILEIMPQDSNNEISDADKWIAIKLNNLNKIITNKLLTYDFTIIGKEINHFIMNDFSSWYIEFSKSKPNKQFAKNILAKLLILLHPFLPFITDHIFKLFNNEELLEHSWVTIDQTIEQQFYIDDVIEVVKAIREFRNDKNIKNTTSIYFWVDKNLSSDAIVMIKKLANALFHENHDALIPLTNFNLFIKLSDEMKASEKQRIASEIIFLEAEIKRAEMILNNKAFLAKAPQEKIEIEKEKLISFKNKLLKLKNTYI